MEKILGLEIGIDSCGWAVINYDKDNQENNEILKSGVRVFAVAENPKTGESLALPRKLARSIRRTQKRKKARVRSIKNLLINNLNLSKDDLFSNNSIFQQKNRIDIWQLRDKALKRKLKNIELARVLIHIAKRRGYKSNRKAEEQGNSEGKKVLTSIERNNELLKSYSTIGQAIYQNSKCNRIRRNKKDSYNNSVSRDMLIDEIKTIFRKQKELNNTFVNDDFLNSYLEILLHQKEMASIDKMVGYCSLEKKPNKRAAKSCFSCEKFLTISKLINIKILSNDGVERAFTKDELSTILELCLKKEELTYKKIKESINLDDTEEFKGVFLYEIDPKTGETKSILTKFKSGFKAYHILKKIVEKALSKKHWQNISKNKNLLNSIATIFSYHKDDKKIDNELQKLDFNSFNEEEKQLCIKALIENISFDKFLNLSVKAIDKLLIFMEEGKKYDEAVALCGYTEIEKTKDKFLRALNKNEELHLMNPIVKRTLAQTRKIINALVRRFETFDKIHIELSREMKKSHKDRGDIKKKKEEYQAIKQEIVNKFVEYFQREPKKDELLKFRLWLEQDGKCVYSQTYIKPEQILESFVQIDHILPLSRSLEDSMNNKVLVLNKENINKKNQTPYEYFKKENRSWDKFEKYISYLQDMKKAKKLRLLKKNFDENSEKAFKDRCLNDTAFSTVFIKNFIENNLFLNSNEKLKVLTRNITLTNLLRHNWKVGDKNRNTHLYHAVDAIIVAFSSQKEVKRLLSLSKENETLTSQDSNENNKQLIFVPPMSNFKEKIQQSVDNIFVSFAPRRGVKGAAHKDTIYSKKLSKPKGHFEVNKGLAERGEVKRVDVFKKGKQYHFVFLYPSDFLKKSLPNLTIKNIQIDGTFKFSFSLFKDELIEIKQANKEPFRGYLKFIESDGRFNILPHFQSQLDKKENRFSSGSFEYIKKYQVDPLGNINEIKSEKRVSILKN